MALSNAEKQQRFRERQKAAKAAGLKRAEEGRILDLFRTPFFETYQRNGNAADFEQCFDMMGLDAPEFDDDSGPRSREGIVDHPENDEQIFGDGSNSLARAEITVGCLLDAASTLAGIINSFKKSELDRREGEILAEIKAKPENAGALADKLLQIRSAVATLDKEVRWPFPSWKVDGSG